MTFETTNNALENETFLLGLEYAREKGIKKLKVSRDVELVINQVHRQYQKKNAKMKAYRNRVWDEIKHFDTFSLFSIPREKNSKVDCLTVSASLLIPHLEFNRDFYIVEMIHRPSVPNNDRH